MGYVGTTHEFLPTAFAALKPGGGTIHYHETCPEELLPARPWARVQAASEAADRKVHLGLYRYVKSYAPGVGHVVLDVAVA
jgi:tRNA wybutosine-synthesizing protein 2